MGLKRGLFPVAKAALSALAIIAATGEAFGEDGIDVPIYLSVFPVLPAPNDNVQLNFSIPNVGIAVGSTFAPEIEFNGNSILVQLVYNSPEIPPDSVGVPSYFFPEASVSLGMIKRGSYSITAVLPGIDDQVFASGSANFDVVPEPNAVVICASTFLLFSLVGVRLTGRCQRGRSATVNPRQHQRLGF